MKKILLTSLVALGFVLVAAAQQEPVKAKLNRKAAADQKAAHVKAHKAKIEHDKALLKGAPAQKTVSVAAEKTSDQ